MSGGGGKGGSQTTSVTVPQWLEQAAQGNLERANKVSEIGYVPYYGPDVAALTPDQVAAQGNNRSAAAAFGLDAGAGSGLPAPQTFAGGVQGYSSAPMFEQAKQELKKRAPGQFNMLTGMFVNPITGARPGGSGATPRAPVAARDPNALVGRGVTADWTLAEVEAARRRRGGMYGNGSDRN